MPGPWVIRKCSACAGLIRQHTILSGNTFGGRYWTDGKRYYPHFPFLPWLVKCARCGTLVWIDEQEKIGEYAFWLYLEISVGTDDDIQLPAFLKMKKRGDLPKRESLKRKDQLDREIANDARPYITPTTEDYLEFLKNETVGREKELYVRRQVWWLGNDSRREGVVASPMSDDEIENLRALAVLLDEMNENDRIWKAEAMRELGEYDKAARLLEFAFGHEAAQHVAAIERLVEQQTPFVKEVDPNMLVPHRQHARASDAEPPGPPEKREFAQPSNGSAPKAANPRCAVARWFSRFRHSV